MDTQYPVLNTQYPLSVPEIGLGQKDLSMQGKRIKPRRDFSEDFKLLRVKEYETGEYTVSEMSRMFKLSKSVLYRWIYKYSKYNKQRSILVEVKDSSTKKLKDYENRIKELEQIVGQKQILIDYYEKLIGVASDDLSIDLKKSTDTKR